MTFLLCLSKIHHLFGALISPFLHAILPSLRFPRTSPHSNVHARPGPNLFHDLKFIPHLAVSLACPLNARRLSASRFQTPLVELQHHLVSTSDSSWGLTEVRLPHVHHIAPKWAMVAQTLPSTSRVIFAQPSTPWARRIDDCWNINGSRDLSDYWTGFTQFTLLEEKPPNGYMWSGRRLMRKQLTRATDHTLPMVARRFPAIVSFPQRPRKNAPLLSVLAILLAP